MYNVSVAEGKKRDKKNSLSQLFLVHSLWVLVFVCLWEWEPGQKDTRQREGGDRGRREEKRAAKSVAENHINTDDTLTEWTSAGFEIHFETTVRSCSGIKPLLGLTFTWQNRKLEHNEACYFLWRPDEVFGCLLVCMTAKERANIWRGSCVMAVHLCFNGRTDFCATT